MLRDRAGSYRDTSAGRSSDLPPSVAGHESDRGGSAREWTASALATKIIAAVGGPAALATLSTLQQIRQAPATAATGNGQTALARGASTLRGREKSEYMRTIACLFAAATALAAGSMMLWPQPLAALAGFGPVRAA